MARRRTIMEINWIDSRAKDESDPLAEESVVSAGPGGFCTVRVYRPGSSRLYYMDCNLIRNPDDTHRQQLLSALTMGQAKEEAVDRIRILLHHVLSDL